MATYIDRIFPWWTVWGIFYYSVPRISSLLTVWTRLGTTLMETIVRLKRSLSLSSYFQFYLFLKLEVQFRSTVAVNFWAIWHQLISNAWLATVHANTTKSGMISVQLAAGQTMVWSCISQCMKPLVAAVQHSYLDMCNSLPLLFRASYCVQLLMTEKQTIPPLPPSVMGVCAPISCAKC